MPLDPTYNPKQWESTITKEWREWNIGSPEVQAVEQNLSEGVETYSIIMPPPNLTAKLHAGHGMNHYLQDTLARIARQQHKKTLMYPGVDHAGLQLEGVINKLLKESGIERKSLTTEEYLKVCWDKVIEWRAGQAEQALMLGTSADYTRELFTLDDRANKMVMHAFKEYYKDGLIYKSSYIVNWSVGLKTALSDVSGEIIYETRKDPLVTFRYGTPEIEIVLQDVELIELSKILTKSLKKTPITVATVRPETIFGDVAVALHPSKLVERLHNQLEPKQVDRVLEAINKSEIIVTLTMPEFGVTSRLLLSDKVDALFGSGALKITPGSDLVDYELYTLDFASYKLPQFLHVVDREGLISDEIMAPFAGMTREKARIKSIELLINSGYITKAAEPKNVPKEFAAIKDIELYNIDWAYEHNVSLCERTKTVIEPLISEEYYLSYHNQALSRGKTLAECAKEGITQTNFYPIEFRGSANNFVDSIKDWCISRDLVWGHRIPVWYNTRLNPLKKLYGPDVKTVTVDSVEYNTADLVQISVHKPLAGSDWEQETKILDTWFSSSLWPLTTLGYYDTNPKIKALVLDISGVFWDQENHERAATIEFIKQIKSAGISVYYLTNLKSQLSIDLLKASPNFGLFDGGISMYESGQSKKSDDIFELLIAKYSLEVSKVLYIDDTASYVARGKELGFMSVWYTEATDLTEALTIALSTRTSDFETFYPTAYMNTAKEIFYLWIVRMITLGVYFTGRSPFRDVLITPTVLDGHGKKMSKSLGNGLQPEDAINDFSSDALRLGMLSGVLPNRNMRFGGDVASASMEKMRNFGNKLWNIARFLEYKQATGAPAEAPAPATAWIVGEFETVLESINQLHRGYDFVATIQSIIDFVWYKFADSYVEYLKTDETQLGNANILFSELLIALHPFMPFETEVLWRQLYSRKTIVYEQVSRARLDSLAGNPKEFVAVIELVDELRSIKGIYGIKPTQNLLISSESNLITKYQGFLRSTAKVELSEAGNNWLEQDFAGSSLSLNVAEYITDHLAEITSSMEQIQKLTKVIEGLQTRLSNEKFVQNASEEAIKDAKDNIESNQLMISNLKSKTVYLHKLANAISEQ